MIIVWNHSSLGFGRSPIRIFPILQKIEVCPGTVETLKGWKYYIRDLEPQLEGPAQCIHQLSAVLKQMFGFKIPPGPLICTALIGGDGLMRGVGGRGGLVHI